MITSPEHLHQRLDAIYARYNKKRYVDPDPLLYLYSYPDKKDREIAGLIAACLAYGQVLQIMKAVRTVLTKMTPAPYEYVMTRKQQAMRKDFKGFKYRFAGGRDMVGLLQGMKTVLQTFGSLENCFYEGLSGHSAGEDTIIPGLVFLCRSLDPEKKSGHLLADPEKKSACKRSHLFLRWMVRQDDVDPGGWDKIPRSQLVVPLDLHMHRTGNLLGFTNRKSADLKTALEITRGFKKITPHDPVKYDFCLTRYGIRSELSHEDLIKEVTQQ